MTRKSPQSFDPASLDGAELLDITPTLLTLAGLTPAADMPGRVLTEALSFEPTQPRVASYETGKRPWTY